MCHLRVTTYGSIRNRGVLLIAFALSASLAGCNNKVFDPTQIGRFRPTPKVNVILDSLGVAEEPTVAWQTAEEPLPEDIRAVKTDYVLQPGDIVRVSIFELLQESVAVVQDYVVTESGKISIPDVGVIQATGLTEAQLEEEIRRILSPNILREPSVTVTLLSSQQRAFSILGNGVPAPGRYVIPRYDLRLMDALALAGVQMQFNVSYIYVSRREGGAEGPVEIERPQGAPDLELIQPGSSQSGLQSFQPVFPGPENAMTTTRPRDIPEPSEPAQRFEQEREMFDLIAPQASHPWPRSDRMMDAVPAKPQETDMSASMLPSGFRVLVPLKRTPNAGERAQGPNLQGMQGTVSQREVLSPTELGMIYPNSGSPRARPQREAPPGVGPPRQGQNSVLGGPSAQPLSGGSRSEERMEWVFEGGQWKQVPARSQQIAPGSPTRTDAPPQRPDAQRPSGPRPRPGGSPSPPAARTPGGQETEWVLRDGQWVQVPKGRGPAPVRPPATAAPRGPTLPLEDGTGIPGADERRRVPGLPMELDWDQAIQTRVIQIPTDRLLAGDRRYNVVIKPGDTIHVPVDLIGEFYIIGNVNRTGVIPITGRPLTLKMAIAAAGGLGPLAAPRRVEVTRRIGTDREEIVMVDLDKIANGEQPDFFIKPNDLVNVGTDATARWRAVLRNAFRATYGFGFVYDRNFADIDYGTGFPWSSNF